MTASHDEYDVVVVGAGSAGHSQASTCASGPVAPALTGTAWRGAASGVSGRVPPPLVVVSTGGPPPSWPYLPLLEAAHSLGRTDGGLAARFEPAGPTAPQSAVCRGREPGEFARLLWAGMPGAPPSGLRLNAPLWYAHGFAEGLAAARRRPGPAEAGRTGGRPAASA